MSTITEDQIRMALRSLSLPALKAGFEAVASGIAPEDWDRNFLAAAFGPPGALRQALQASDPFLAKYPLPLWSTNLGDALREVMSESAALLHWASFQDPEQLANVCAARIAALTGQPVSRPLRKDRKISTDPRRARQEAAALLRSTLDEAKRQDLLRTIERDGLEQWTLENHFGIGMGVRNALRKEGFTETALGTHSLDEVWAELIFEALSIPIESPPPANTRASPDAPPAREPQHAEPSTSLASEKGRSAWPHVADVGLTFGRDLERILSGSDESAELVEPTDRSVVEALCFTMHVFDRMVSQSVPLATRNEYMDAMFGAASAQAQLLHYAITSLAADYNARNARWSQYSELWPAADDKRGTLAWEFAKALAYPNIGTAGLVLIAIGEQLIRISTLLENPDLGFR